MKCRRTWSYMSNLMPDSVVMVVVVPGCGNTDQTWGWYQGVVIQFIPEGGAGVWWYWSDLRVVLGCGDTDQTWVWCQGVVIQIRPECGATVWWYRSDLSVVTGFGDTDQTWVWCQGIVIQFIPECGARVWWYWSDLRVVLGCGDTDQTWGWCQGVVLQIRLDAINGGDSITLILAHISKHKFIIQYNHNQHNEASKREVLTLHFRLAISSQCNLALYFVIAWTYLFHYGTVVHVKHIVLLTLHWRAS